MPIIDQLLDWGAEVVIGGDGRSLHLLRREYPELKFIELPSYNVRYTSGSAMVAMTLALIPNYLAAIYKEHVRLKNLIDEEGIDLVISDNRYGLWTNKVPCAVLCHQVSIIPPKLIDWSVRAVYRLHLLFLHRFERIWIPDFAGASNLSGLLSHRYPPGEKMEFIGPLSRFAGMTAASAESGQVLVVLSGPEPQRSILEDIVVRQAREMKRAFLVVQGKTEHFEDRRDGNVRIVSFMDAGTLLEEFSRSSLVVARSGYSTIMDLYALGKKAVFIPTPGQTEQEYLAEQLAGQGMAVVQRQDALNLSAALEKAERISGFPVLDGPPDFTEVLRKFAEEA